MSLQIWLLRDIENILWATQAVMQAAAIASEGSDRSAAYDRGFKSAMQYVTQSFDTSPLSQKISSCEDIEKALLAIRAVTLPTMASSGGQTRAVNYNRDFSRGLEVALWCIATSFGVNLVSSRSGPLAKRTQFSPPDSSLLWFHEDIKNILLAVQRVMEATVSTLEGEARPKDYDQGFEDALRCVAKSFGVRLLTESSFPLEKAMLSPLDPFWPHEDIENKLLVVYATMQIAKTASENNGRPAVYWRGFEAALRCIATSFGVRVSLG